MFTAALSSLIVLMTAVSADTSYTVDPSTAVFAVITHKAGMVAALAHNHFIAPNSVEVEASMPERDISRAQFHVRFPVTALQVDNVEAQKKFYPVLHSAGIMEAPFTKISDSDRALVHKHMLAEGQLDAEHFPEIEAKLVRFEKKPVTMGETKFEYEAVVALTVRGKTVEHPFGINVTEDAGHFRIVGAGQFKFTDFGFEPYSGLMGMVRNEDPFFIFVDFTATPTSK